MPAAFPGKSFSRFQIVAPAPGCPGSLARVRGLVESKTRFRRAELGARGAADTCSGSPRPGTGALCAILDSRDGTKSAVPRDECTGVFSSLGYINVLGRPYFTRQAATLLKFAKLTSNPALAASLVERAADLKAQIDSDKRPDA